MRSGSVVLVGAGPGRADFLTLAGLKAIQQATVILYDALLAPDIRSLFPKKVTTVFVGKRCGRHALSQEQINALLVDYAKQGQRVVRLKGGDPFIFGRGAEEVEALRKAGISYRIVPGVSAMNGIGAQLSLPLTARGLGNEFRAIQGHKLPDDARYWQGLADYEGTLVIFMGVENIASITSRLLTHGAVGDRPLAVVETGEHGHLHTTRSTVEAIYRSGFARKTSGPGIIYIGSNVNLIDESALGSSLSLINGGTRGSNQDLLDGAALDAWDRSPRLSWEVGL